MDFWDKVKSDMRKGIKEGVGFVREGVSVVREKAEELTEEGRKRLKIFDLKTRVHREIAELGGRVYDTRAKVKNPLSDSKVKAIIARVEKLEAKIERLESVPKKAKVKKTAPKRKARPGKKLKAE